MKDLSIQLLEWNKRAWEINRSSPKEAIELATRALSASKIIQDKKQKAISRFIIGTAQVWISEYEKSIQNLHKAKSYFQKSNDNNYSAKCLYSLGTWYYYLSDFEESLKCFVESLRLYELAENIVGQADANNGIGSVYYEVGNYEESFDVLSRSYDLLQNQEKEEHIEAKVLHGLGKASYLLKKYDDSEKYFLQCLKLCVKNNYSQEYIFVNEGLTMVYEKKGQLEKVQHHLDEAKNMSIKIEFKIGLAKILFLKGKILLESNEKEAFKAFYEANEIAEEIDNIEVLCNFHKIISDYYEKQKKFELTVFHLRQFQEFSSKLDKRKHGLHLKSLQIKINLERVEKENEIYKIKNKELNFRSEYLKESNERIRTIGQLGQEITSKLELEELLSLINKQVHNLMQADVLYVGLHNEELQKIQFPFYIRNKRRLKDVEISMDNTGKFTVWCIKNEKEVVLNDFDKQASDYITLVDSYSKDKPPSSVMILPIKIKDKVIGVIGVHSYKKNSYSNEKVDILKALGAFVSIALENARIYKSINDLNSLIENKRKEILDSINYAKRLQEAILPSENLIRHYLPNTFVLYKPKDVVSGDFYWFERFNEITFIAAADCTGHGVPGAMVSVICSGALNRAVNEFGIDQPAEILNKARELVMGTFAKSGDNVHDGMDISLCAIKDNKLVYSGANNPLWIVRKTEKLNEIERSSKYTLIKEKYSLIEHKADKQPIGFYEDMRDFNQLEMEVYDGDQIYLFSDGFADQFGGERDKKFKSLPFKSLLIDIHSLSSEKQKAKLESTFDNWKGDEEQIDDVCVIGVQITPNNS